jgi:hypothetical protein
LVQLKMPCQSLARLSLHCAKPSLISKAMESHGTRGLRMEHEKSRDLAQGKSGATHGEIRIDGLILLTGMTGLFSLIISWTLAIACAVLLAAAAYVAIAIDWMAVFFTGLGALMVLGGCLIARWIARGFLQGRQGRSVIGCILMLAVAAIGAAIAYFTAIGYIEAGDNKPRQVLWFALNALTVFVFAALLIASFHNRRYWGKKQ